MSRKYNDAGQANETGIEHIDGLYGYAMFLTGNHAEAEDLVQETYVRALQAMTRLKDDNKIKGWLFTILRNVWLNELRKRRNGPQLVELDIGNSAQNSTVEPPNDAHHLYVNKMYAEQVRAAMQALPLNQREIIVLREYEELSYQQIAIVLNCPLGTNDAALIHTLCFFY
jgi:RNA polymerase sigma-70 factor (ECF subfamily)